MENKVIIEIVIEDNCIKCPYCKHTRTKCAGFALDYHCTHTKDYRKIMGYIEWSREIKPIPEWCPFRK